MPVLPVACVPSNPHEIPAQERTLSGPLLTCTLCPMVNLVETGGGGGGGGGGDVPTVTVAEALVVPPPPVHARV